MDVKEVGFEGVEQVRVLRDTDQLNALNTLMKFRVAQRSQLCIHKAKYICIYKEVKFK